MINLFLQMMESEALKNLFLKLVNMSISASWIVLVVLILRLVLKKAPKWIPVLLWRPRKILCNRRNVTV